MISPEENGTSQEPESLFPKSTRIYVNGQLDGSGRVHTTTSNAEGVFEAKGLTPGMWRVYARAAGYVVPSAPLIDVGTETPDTIRLRVD